MAERKEKNALPTQGGREKETCTGWEQVFGINCGYLRKIRKIH